MNNIKAGIISFISISIALLIVSGYILNFGKFFFTCDFERINKCEIVRGIGIVMPPVGVIAGHFDIEK